MMSRRPPGKVEARVVGALLWIQNAMIAAILVMLFLAIHGCAGGPIRRALDSELGVLCYYTNTAMSCIPVQVKKRGHRTDEASHKSAGLPASSGGAE